MTPGGTVNFSYEWEREPNAPDGDHEYIKLEVEAKISDYRPMTIGDPCLPAEGGEVEELTATLPDGTTLSPIPSDIDAILCDLAIEEHQDA